MVFDVYKYSRLKGTTFAIWFPAIMSPFLVTLMRTFITGSVPDAIVESAKIDGAGTARFSRASCFPC